MSETAEPTRHKEMKPYKQTFLRFVSDFNPTFLLDALTLRGKVMRGVAVGGVLIVWESKKDRPSDD